MRLPSARGTRRPGNGTTKSCGGRRAHGRRFGEDNWIFVSRTSAASHGRDRYVYNGLNPEDYVFSETKDEYLLFMAALDVANDKGLDRALQLSVKAGIPLISLPIIKTWRMQFVFCQRMLCSKRNPAIPVCPWVWLTRQLFFFHSF